MRDWFLRKLLKSKPGSTKNKLDNKRKVRERWGEGRGGGRRGGGAGWSCPNGGGDYGAVITDNGGGGDCCCQI